MCLPAATLAGSWRPLVGPIFAHARNTTGARHYTRVHKHIVKSNELGVVAEELSKNTRSYADM